MDNTILKDVPVVGWMRQNAEGGFDLVPELSEFRDIPAKAVAKFLMQGLNVSGRKVADNGTK